MKIVLFITLLILMTSSQKCTDYLYNEVNCISSNLQSCRWNAFMSQCVDSISTNLGCNSALNEKACLAQLSYPDNTLAECMFSGYCRKVETTFTTCSSILSRAACLSVYSATTKVKCIWQDGCSTISESEAISLASVDSLSPSLQQSSVGVCQLITNFLAIHQAGAHTALVSLYRATILGSNPIKLTYKNDLQNPGCLVPNVQMLLQIDCDAFGLNVKACISIPNKKCIFRNNQCETVTDFTNILCSNNLSELACLSVTNMNEPCYWNNGSCQKLIITASTKCTSFDYSVSPSVCSNILVDECFYDDQNQSCSQKCRSTDNKGSQLICKQSVWDCVWKDISCIFNLTSQCGMIGQNQLGCNLVPQNCRFFNGFCIEIESLSLLKCRDGLNKMACLNLSNSSQVCQFDITLNKCLNLIIEPGFRCVSQTNVNANACRKITTEGCYYQNGNCQTTSGSEACTTEGLNKLACLSTSNTTKACRWDVASGTCMEKEVSRAEQCNTLTLVNPVACKNVIYRTNGVAELCRYNEVSYSCENFTVDSSTTCSTKGLNAKACASISNDTLACRWLSNSCVQVTSLGIAISCSSLQNVTFQTCALIQESTEKCIYSSSRQSCTTSVKKDFDCTAPGLNPRGCASLATNCYFNTTTNLCSTPSGTVLSTIDCASNYPTKQACQNITTSGQYCRWNSISSICVQQSFPTTYECTDFTDTNKSLCLAYEQSTDQWITATSFCTYNSTTKACAIFIATITACGSTDSINVHACVALSDPTYSCYFNTTTLQCTTLTDNTVLTTLKCQYGNKKVCTSITTNGQDCQWYQDSTEKKCQFVYSFTDECEFYLAVNPNVCAQISGTACMWEQSSTNCIVPTGVAFNCANNGFNEAACITTDQEPCYYDKSLNNCIKIDSTNSTLIGCSAIVNQQGCLASLKMPCKWDGGVCSEVTDKVWDTVTCSALTDALYNPIVCGNVTTSNEYCSYDSASSHCQDSPVVSDCLAGYNLSNCTGTGCEFKNSICSDKPSPPTNVCTGKNQADCMAVTTAACVYSSGNCLSVTILSSATCTTYQSVSNKFNAVTCQSITGSACQYDATNFKCIAASGAELTCTEPGLNYLACILNTKGNYCKFESNFSKTSPGCSQIADISTESCSNTLSKEACLNISNAKGICRYDVVNNACSEIDNQLIIGGDCSDATDPATYIYTSNYCKYLTTTSCQYNAVTNVCQTSSSVENCATDTSLNEIACYQNVYGQTCSFSTYSFTCSVMSTTVLKQLTCSSALSFKQCTQAGGGICKWNGTACSTATINVSCTSLSNINSRACMANVNGTEKCQFQDSVSSTSCVIPADDTQACAGLNKVACLANTVNPCYFYEQCIDISLSPDDGACDTGFYLTQGACMRIQKAGQTCQWDGTACIKHTVSSTDTCTSYSAPTNSPAICASIVTSSCYWNMGCQSGNAATCNTLGANSLACKGATAGNCIFTNYRCLDVQTNDVQASQCTDPSNQNGCLQLNNGQPCQWSGSTCSKVSVSGGCTSYTSVNPGVCAQTSDIACQWNSNACVAVSSSTLTCTDKGLNKLGCLTKTSGSMCRYFGSLCVTVDQMTINGLECSDNLNEEACKAHAGKCCSWDGSNCSSMGSVSVGCDSLTNNSAYCCGLVESQNCGYYGSCYELTYQDVFCQEAFNKLACMWITGSCQWDDANHQCIPANKSNLGCISSLNKTACFKQSDFCMFDGVCKTGLLDSCDKLLYSNSAAQCKSVTDVGCKSYTNGCVPTGYNTVCGTANMNKIGCIDNINSCQWNATTLICSNANPNTAAGCATGLVSRGECMKIASCRMDISNETNTCVDYNQTSSTLCSDLNAISGSPNTKACIDIVSGPCMFDSTNLKCIEQITGTVCTTYVGNSIGCKYIQNKCYWDSSAVNGGCKKYSDSTIFYSCSDIYTKYTCLSNKLTACIWTSTHQCQDYTDDLKTCAQLIADVTSPGVCYYYSSDFCSYNGTTCQLQASVTNCIEAASPLGCQAAGSLCYWNTSQTACLQLVSSDQANNMTCPNLKYTTKTLCLKPILEGQICEWDGNLCQSANVTTAYCTNDLALNACIAVNREAEQCKFQSACAYADNSTTICTDNLNIYACLAVLSDSQYCKWLGQRCSAVTDDGFLIQTHTLINRNVCRKAYTLNGQPNASLEDIGVKYDIDNFICVLSDPMSDDCSDPGLNYYGCLRTQVALCNWSGSKCIYFTDDGTSTTCAGYNTVSPKVCSQISTAGLKCKHNDSTLSCENYSVSSDTCDTIGLNKEACINIKLAACIWLNSFCTFNTLQVGETTCESLKDVNAYSCALVDVSTQSCKYNNQGGCSSQIDPNVERCDTAGMNKKACSLVEGQSCIFKNDHCQVYNGDESVCTNLKEVNASVCQNLDSEQQPCKFSILTRSCTFVHSEDTCSAQGINKQGCKLIQANQQCTWLDDLKQYHSIFSYCTCNGVAAIKGIKSCSGLGEYQCTGGCYWNQISNVCNTKLCSTLNLENCGGTLNGYHCYKTNTSCQGASKCSQISGVTDCTLFTINGTKCGNDPYNNGHCIEYGCPHISENSCGGQCQWSGSCMAKQCYTLKKEDCVGVFSGQQCYWTGTQCIGVASCAELTQYINGDSTVCEAYTIGGRQCKWQIDKLFSKTYECNSTACRTLGSSVSNCHGKEMNNEVCVLLPDFNCISCEEISDACMCLNANGYCLLSGQKCISNICSNLNESTCSTTKRCIYIDKQCKQICPNLDYTQCLARSLLSQCSWNTYLGICEDGVQQTVVINTLASVVDAQAYCQILLFASAFLLF